MPAAVALPNEGVSINPDVVEAVEAKEEAAAAAAGDDKKAKSKSPKRKKTKAGTVVFEPAEPLGGPAGTHDGQVMTTTTNDPATAPHKHVKVEHPATKCACETNDEHFKNVAMDTTFPTTPEKIYNLMYQSGLMKKFWSESQKLTGAFRSMMTKRGRMSDTWTQSSTSANGHPGLPARSCSSEPGATSCP